MRTLTTVVAAACISTILVATVALAATPTPAPSTTQIPSPTSTAAAIIPNAPSNVKIDVGARRVTWQDNSDNETEFLITYTVSDGATTSVTYTVGPSVTSFSIPPDAPAFSCGHTLEIKVAALHGSTASAPAGAAIASVCPPPSLSSGANAGQPSGLPATGIAGDQAPSSLGLRVALAAMILLASAALIGVGVRTKIR